MLTKFCCFGQSMDFADNAKYVKRVLLLFPSVALFQLSFPVQGLARSAWTTVLYGLLPAASMSAPETFAIGLHALMTRTSRPSREA